MPEPEKFVFLLVEDFSHIAFACAVEPLRIANLVADRELYQWRLASEDGRTGAASNRCVTQVDQGLEPLPRGDWLMVISGLGVRERISQPIMSYLRKERARGVRLGAICSGAYVLARAGLLDGQACAIHWEFHDAFTEEFPDVALRRSVFVADAPIVSASGGPATADLMLHLIAKRHGSDLATSVADQMVYNSVRGDESEQRVSPGARHGFRSEPLKRALREIDRNLEETISTAELAERSGVTTRQLERLFGRYLNCSPKKYYRDARLHKARNLLLQTDLSIAEVAIACGFASPTHFARAYRQTYGVAPSVQRACRAR